ncbi:hypothetical protein GCM10010404_82660 [Nonomuraea africana]
MTLTVLEALQMDEHEVARAAQSWKRMAERLDPVIEVLEGLPERAALGWIAEDEKEFARAARAYLEAVRDLRAARAQTAEVLEELVAAFKMFKLVTVIHSLVLLWSAVYVLSLSMGLPQLAPLARLRLAWLINAADKVLSGLIAAFMSACAAQTAVLGLAVARGEKLLRLPVPDFARAGIDTKGHATFRRQDKEGRLPDGTESFRWVAPVIPREE